MVVEVKLTKSDNPKKKYKAVVESKDRKKTIHFGAAGMSDYTKHKDDKRKARYIARHKKREDWTDPFTSGYWSRWLLWGKKTIKASKADIEKTKNIKFK